MYSLHRRFTKPFQWFNVRAISLACLCLVAFLAACGGSTNSGNDDKAPITVWIDSTRQAAVDAFLKANPQDQGLIKTVLVDRTQFPAKVLLYNNISSGWPDVVFAEPNLVAQVADAAHHFPLDLTSYVDPSVVSSFAGISACQFDGKLYCLPNDLAMDTVWYNKPLMDQFGYTVPTTWEQYEALGLQVAKDHPGYIIGSFGDGAALGAYFGGSNCPLQDPLPNSKVYINTSDPNCVRAAQLADTLIAAGSMSTKGPFDPDFVKIATNNKLLMFIGAAWFGDTFKTTYYPNSKGVVAVAPPFKWASDSQAYTGNYGGGAWTVSSHAQNKKLAAAFVAWVTSATNGYQATAPGYPAYKPAAQVWSQTIANDPIYATNPFPVFQQAANDLYPQWGEVRYDDYTPFTTTVIANVIAGKSAVSALPDFQKALVPLAQAQGYNVVTTAP